ncbi:MAG: hypothetical protein ACRDB0_03070 [Paraclostridium sp.]
MFLKYQMYKGYILISDHNTLNEIEKDIKEDLKNGELEDSLAIRLNDIIREERNTRLKIMSI